MPCCNMRQRMFAARSASTSATAAWKLAAISAAILRGQRAGRVCARPAAPRRSSARRKRNRSPAGPAAGGAARSAPDRRSRASASSAGPPGQPRPSSLATCRTPRPPRRPRAAEPAVAAHALDRDALAMPAGEQQQQIGKWRAARHQPGQPRGQRMRLQMVDRDDRAGRRAIATPLAKPVPTISPPISPGPAVAATAARSAKAKPGLAQHALAPARQMRQMRARGDFRHHAAECRVIGLADHRTCPY